MPFRVTDRELNSALVVVGGGWGGWGWGAGILTFLIVYLKTAINNKTLNKQTHPQT